MATRIVTGLFAFILTATLMLGVCILYIQQEMDKAGPLTKTTTVIIAKGTSVGSIADTLQSNGIIDNRYFFRLRHYIDGLPALKAGEYAFAPHATLKSIVMDMAAGRVVPRKLTIPEGLTSAEIVDVLNKNDALTGNIIEIPAEGNMLPETYRYSYGDDRNVIIIRMQKAMADALENAWQSRNPDLPLNNPQELLILASIVEKETGIMPERARVAGVFINRLRKKMPLQSDPTVTYGITLGKQPLGRALNYGDLAKNSLYNTYRIPALPPGPIANPGKSALMAVAKPEKNDFIFFVADGSGGHRFAVTHDEHLKNVAFWRQVQKDKK